MPSRGPSPVPEREKKHAPETEEFLRAALGELFQCKMQGDLRDRIGRMHWEFYAQERVRKTASDTN